MQFVVVRFEDNEDAESFVNSVEEGDFDRNSNVEVVAMFTGTPVDLSAQVYTV